MSRHQLVVIGGSAGGVNALKVVLSGLGKDFPMPIAVVLHRGKDSDEQLAAILQRESAMTIVEACDKQPIESGCVYLAPADYHLLIEDKHFALSLEAPVHHSRPSIDVFFHSAADAFGDAVIGVIMSGKNRDGADGLIRIKQAGGIAIAQDPKTAENSTMPDAAIAAAKVDYVVPIEGISSLLIKLGDSN